MKWNRNVKKAAWTPCFSEEIKEQYKLLLPFSEDTIIKLINNLIEENKQLRKQIDSLIRVLDKQINRGEEQ